jgi:hypothetical protein
MFDCSCLMPMVLWGGRRPAWNLRQIGKKRVKPARGRALAGGQRHLTHAGQLATLLFRFLILAHSDIRFFHRLAAPLFKDW